MSPHTLAGDKAEAIRALEGVRSRHPAEADALRPAIGLLEMDLRLLALQQIVDCSYGCGVVLSGGFSFGCPVHGDSRQVAAALRENDTATG